MKALNYRSTESIEEQKRYEKSIQHKKEELIDEMLEWYMHEIKGEKEFKVYKRELISTRWMKKN